MVLQYAPRSPTSKLEGEHSDAITAVAFSPDGRLLVSAAIDHNIVIWSLSLGKVLYCIAAKSPVLCLAWPSCSEVILAGTADGTLVSLHVSEREVSAVGFFAHERPIESLSMACASIIPQQHVSSFAEVDPALHTSATCIDHWLATAASDEVKIWHFHDSSGTWFYQQTLAQPPSTPFSGERQAEVTTVEWLATPNSDHLVVSYLYHGIICWHFDGDDVSVIWSIHTLLCGRIRVGINNTLLLANNVITGFDVYEIPSGLRRLGVCAPNEKPNMILPMVFHDSRFLLSASTVGKLRLRSAINGEHFQTLRLDDRVPIQAVDVFRSSAGDRYMVAAGTAVVKSANYIQVWETRETTELSYDDQNKQTQ